MEAVPTKTPRQIRIANAIFFFVSGFGYTTWTSRIVYIQQSLHLNEEMGYCRIPGHVQLHKKVAGGAG